MGIDAVSAVNYSSGKKILISIKKDAYFNDGGLITADDVIASFNYLKSSRLVFRNVFTWVKSINKISSNQVLIELNKF